MPPSCIKVGVVLQLGGEGGRNTSARQKKHASLVHFKANLRVVLVGSIYEFGGLNQCDMAPGEITNGRRARRAHQSPETQSGRGGRQTSSDGGRPRNAALPAKNRETILANRASGASGASNFRHCARAGRIPATVEPERDA